MPNYLNTQVDSAIANLLVLPNDIDPDYDIYTSNYASKDIINPSSSDKRRVTAKVQIGIKSNIAHSEKRIPLLESIKTCSPTPIALGSCLQPSKSQKDLSSDENVSPKSDDTIPEKVQDDMRDEIQPPSIKSSHSQLQPVQDCECVGECSDADLCQKLDSMNAQIVAMIEEGELALDKESPNLDCKLSSTIV